MTLILIEALTFVAISSFLYEAVVINRRGGALALKSAAASLSPSIQKLLYAAFLFSLVSIQLTSWTFYATGKYLPYYNILIILYYAVILVLCGVAYRFVSYDLRILLLMFYLFAVPSALSGYGITEILIGLKYTLIPFLLYFFFRTALDTMEEVRVFLRLIVFAGALTALYVIFELANRFTGIWPGFWLAAEGFIEAERPAYVNYIRDFIYLKSFLVRPLGIFLDIYSQGFLIMAALLITIIMGRAVISERAIFLLQPIFILGILLSTVKSYIVILVLSLMGLFLFNSWKLKDSGMRKRLISSALFLSATVLLTLAYFYKVLLHMFGRLLNLTTAGSATHEIIFDEMLFFFTKKLPYLLSHRPLNAMFGFGYGTELSLAGEAHFFGRQVAVMGIIGFALYWSIIARSCREGLMAAGRQHVGDLERRLFLFGALMCMVLAATLFHYSPLNVCNNFVAAFMLYIGELAYGHNRGLYLSAGGRP